jgi:hypothetical protein
VKNRRRRESLFTYPGLYPTNAPNVRLHSRFFTKRGLARGHHLTESRTEQLPSCQQPRAGEYSAGGHYVVDAIQQLLGELGGGHRARRGEHDPQANHDQIARDDRPLGRRSMK